MLNGKNEKHMAKNEATLQELAVAFGDMRKETLNKFKEQKPLTEAQKEKLVSKLESGVKLPQKPDSFTLKKESDSPAKETKQSENLQQLSTKNQDKSVHKKKKKKSLKQKNIEFLEKLR